MIGYWQFLHKCINSVFDSPDDIPIVTNIPWRATLMEWMPWVCHDATLIEMKNDSDFDQFHK